jgi:hypothetical protein
MRDEAPVQRPYRKFGILRHTFPEMTPIERVFVWSSVVAGCVMIVVVGPATGRSGSLSGLALVAAIAGGTLCYWMRQEPAAVLDLFVFPYTAGSLLPGRAQIRWPRWMLAGVRVFGVCSFFGAVSGAALFDLPATWTGADPKAPVWHGLALIALEICFCFYVLRKRAGARVGAPS